jgi:hypothetical protein
MVLGIAMAAAFVAFGSTASAQFVTPPDRLHHVRAVTPQAQRLVDRGIAGSQLFRELVERINSSDVVVYIRVNPVQSRRFAGQLRFLARVESIRYLSISLNAYDTALRQIATLAHELQHAVEIVERPDVVDDTSLKRTYKRLGSVRQLGGRAPMFETIAAIDAGERVRQELRTQ